MAEEGGLSTFHTSPFGKTRAEIALDRGGNSLAEYLLVHRAHLSGAQMEYVSLAGGSERSGGIYTYSPPEASVKVYVGGSLSVIKPNADGAILQGNDPPMRRSGDIDGFSSASRRRLMRLIATTERDNRPIFVTLTYPDEFPSSHSKWKRDMDVFGKRFSRAFSEGSFVWRIEFKERKTGQRSGDIAPHYHLLVWGVSIVDFRAFAPSAWYGTVGSGDARHLRAGTSSQRVRSWGGAMSYTSKYIAKEDTYPDGWRGRVWGVVGREKIPWAVEVVIRISAELGVTALRMARKMMKLKGRVLSYGVSVMLNSERMLDYLEWLVGDT